MTHSRDFSRTLRCGSCAADGTLVLFALTADPTRPPRLGITVPRKVGNAVVRNRWKRLIRESFRTQQDRLPVGYDYIVRPKKDAQPRWESIRDSVPALARRAVARASRPSGAGRAPPAKPTSRPRNPEAES